MDEISIIRNQPTPCSLIRINSIGLSLMSKFNAVRQSINRIPINSHIIRPFNPIIASCTFTIQSTTVRV